MKKILTILLLALTAPALHSRSYKAFTAIIPTSLQASPYLQEAAFL